MLILESERFLKLMEHLHVLQGLLMPGAAEFDITVDAHDRKEANEMVQLLKEMRLTNSHKSAARLESYLQGDTIKRAPGFEKISALTCLIQDELNERVLLLLTEEEANTYRAVEPFGPEFANRFRSAAYELDEAEKCMALGRHTAAVFHWMRVVEIGLRAVSKCLGAKSIVPGTGRSWGNIIRDLRLLRTGSPPKWPENSYFSSVVSSLEAVKHAWRDDTMHVENKYGQTEAEAIRIAVRALMQTIASRMTERGTPKAAVQFGEA